MSRKHKRRTYQAQGLDGKIYQGFFYRDKDGQYIGERIEDEMFDAIFHEIIPETLTIIGGKEE